MNEPDDTGTQQDQTPAQRMADMVATSLTESLNAGDVLGRVPQDAPGNYSPYVLAKSAAAGMTPSEYLNRMTSLLSEPGPGPDDDPSDDIA